MQGKGNPSQGADNLFMQGLSLHRQGHIERARALYMQVLQQNPAHFDALHLLGVIAANCGNAQDAKDWFARAIQVNSGNAAAHFNLGDALRDLLRLEESLSSYDRAIALNPEMPEAHCGRGLVLHQMNRSDEALASYAHAINLKPDYAEAHFNRGEALKDLQRHDQALISYDAAIRLRPDVGLSWCGRGIVLGSMRRFDEAIASYRRAIEITPRYPNAYLGLGSALKDIGQLEDALAVFEQATAIKPDFAEAYASRGSVLHGMSRFDEALASYQHAIDLKPSFEYLLGLVIHIRDRLCAWDRFEADRLQLSNAINRAEKVSPPFIASTVVDDPELQHRAAEIWVRSKFPFNEALGPICPRRASARIRLAYYSADFHDHATCCLMAELFELHDKDRFELIAFSYGPDRKDDVRRRVAAAFDKFIDVRSMSDIDVARLSRQLGVDIAVDLKGHTQNGRPGIFSYRCAPVQVNYLGHPGTTGADYIDYIIADQTLIPGENQVHYSEKIVYLPHSYQVNDTKRKPSEKVFTRESFGLPAHGFVFCCFNNSFKITPHTFDSWIRILKAVEGSVLWLLDDNPSATQSLKQAAQSRGIDPDRMVFGPRLPQAEHLARHRCADLFLDTLPCNAHTTASDALWIGLPVLTLIGNSFAGRVAASLLTAMDLPELIVRNRDSYEQLAVAMATSPSLHANIMQKTARNRACAPLYNTVLFTRHLESAFTQMHNRYCSGAAPDHLHVSL